MDKLLHVRADPDYLLHLDFQSGHDSAQLPPRLRLYNAAQAYRRRLPVFSNVVLLRPEADSPQLTGAYTEGLPGEEPYGIFRYRVIRVWELPVEPLLAGGLGTLPLAPISNVSQAQLPDVIRRMSRRLRRDSQAKDLWAATKVLLGLRYSHDLVDVLLQGVMGMKESSTYQAIVAEGRAEGRTEGLAEGRIVEAQRFLLALGGDKFGPADEATRAAIEAVANVERLETLGRRVLTTESWQELLAQPAPRSRATRRKSARG
jgi:predicted transposase YdaD